MDEKDRRQLLWLRDNLHADLRHGIGINFTAGRIANHVKTPEHAEFLLKALLDVSPPKSPQEAGFHRKLMEKVLREFPGSVENV